MQQLCLMYSARLVFPRIVFDNLCHTFSASSLVFGGTLLAQYVAEEPDSTSSWHMVLIVGKVDPRHLEVQKDSGQRVQSTIHAMCRALSICQLSTSYIWRLARGLP